MKKSMWVLMASTMAVVGCGSPAGLVPVSGKVLYRGQPAAGAVVYFHRQAAPGTDGGAIPSGVVEDDGSFTLTTDGLGQGARPGSYVVLVEWREEKGDGVVPVKSLGHTKLVKRSRVRAGVNRMKGRYLDISKPLLRTEVGPGTGPLAFELVN